MFLKVPYTWLYILHCLSCPVLDQPHFKGGQHVFAKVFIILNFSFILQVAHWLDHTSRIFQIFSYQASVIQFREKEAQNLLHRLPYLFQNYFPIPHVSSEKVCMIGSTLFHTFLCHSPSVAQFWLSCDRVSLPQCIFERQVPSGRDPLFTVCHLPPGPGHNIPLPPSP